MSASKPGIGSDLVKVDAYVNTQADYDETPEVTDEQFARATMHENGKPVRGRPPLGSGPKKPVSLRLDAEVEKRFRASGPGWQTRMNTFLARNETVVRMIVGYDDAITNVEAMLEEMRSGGLRPIEESLSASIAKVERNIARDRDVVRSLREELVWELT